MRGSNWVSSPAREKGTELDECTEAVGCQHDPVLVLEPENRRSRHDRLSTRAMQDTSSQHVQARHTQLAHGETRATGPRNSLSVLDALCELVLAASCRAPPLVDGERRVRVECIVARLAPAVSEASSVAGRGCESDEDRSRRDERVGAYQDVLGKWFMVSCELWRV